MNRYTGNNQRRLGFFSSRFLQFAAGMLCLLCCGCIRVRAGAGTWHEGSGEEAAHVHALELDTQDLVQRDRNEGNISF